MGPIVRDAPTALSDAVPMSGTTRDEHERWLIEVTSLPTAAGREEVVVAWIERWMRGRRDLRMRRDRAGNVLIVQRARRRRGAAGRPPAPLVITAHLDHPAFVVTEVQGSEVTLEFRGGVHDAYFPGAPIEIRDRAGQVHSADVAAIDAEARPFKRVTAWLTRPDAAPANGGASRPAEGDLARWRFEGGAVPRVADGRLYTHACDDLAAVAAALAAFDHLVRTGEAGHVSLLFTRAEEVGFVGAIAACHARSVPAGARLICLETSRSFVDSPIGGGPVVRVGDRTGVFHPDLTNAITALMVEHERTHPRFRWQRKLMPGGTCEATAFGAYGYRASCLCLPLGNYHNMVEIDDALAGGPAVVGPEVISLEDFHGLVEMLIVCAIGLGRGVPPLRARMEALLREYGHVLAPAEPRRRRPPRRRRGSRRLSRGPS
jgi:endoglucanase